MMLSKGCIGYERNIALGMVTGLSSAYLIDRLASIKECSDSDNDELTLLFQKFERNIDKEKKAKILSMFRR